MYAKDSTTIIDRREMLKVKIKTLAAEARIIREQEKRSRGQLRGELRDHRVMVVRDEARHSLIAYAIIRGKPIPEKEGSKAFSMDRVSKMVVKYGSAEQRAEIKKGDQARLKQAA